jgi:hypothetical protein
MRGAAHLVGTTPGHGEAGRPRGRILEEARLADAGLAGDQRDAPRTLASAREHAVEPLQLPLTPHRSTSACYHRRAQV